MIPLRLALLSTARRFAPVETWRPPTEPASIVIQVDDPLRCRCPECLVLDVLFPREGYHLALFPYVVQRRVR